MWSCSNNHQLVSAMSAQLMELTVQCVLECAAATQQCLSLSVAVMVSHTSLLVVQAAQ